MKYSVSLQTEGDREITLDEVVDLADAVAPLNGIATGMGTFGYGAQIVVEAESSQEAATLALELFERAVASTTLPVWPIVRVETLGEDEDFAEDDFA
ncbi:MAG: hypothetical protein KGN78_07295 [Actinomycetales bacterium]|nr:hypothetical protein [Actinomycetales bacterium]